ncbi:WD domain-containing protein [Xylariomycetidae sp. FL2044]|nr:WD domain-containing protein [Xylariomycetidae sp. FL2044]
MYNVKTMRRLLGRPNTDPSADSNLGVTNSPTSQSYRPNASQNAAFPSAVPVACIDRSSDGRLAVLGGRHILKTVHINGSEIDEGVDVRAAISAQFANKGNVANVTADQLSIKDVKLASNHGNDHSIFTACASGKIFMYDISRLGTSTGLEFIQTREDSRQVNKLDFNPHRGTWLLSGGQDGIVRCFDVKSPVPSRSGLTFRTIQAFRCNADGIRDVKWAPRDGMIFACATESGAVLKWDIRKSTAPLLKINAHDTQKGISSISWHPDGDHLISAGFDSKCHVWDLSKNAERKQKPKWTINAPAPVMSVAWRPGFWSATAQGRRAAQVAVSYDDGGHLRRHGMSSVHIWDLARPTMPYKEIDMFENSPYALLWHDQDLLWTGGQDGFTQCDVAFAPRVVDRQPLSSLDFSAKGDVLMFLEERVHMPRPRPAVMAHEVLPASSYSSSPSGQMLSISRSDSEEDVIGSFLGPKRRISSKRRVNHRSTSTLSTTPPSGPGVEDQVISLEQAIKLTIPFKPRQIMAVGKVPAVLKTDTYQYFSQQYLEILERFLPCSKEGRPLDERVFNILELYARAAESVSQFRLAQTWRILSYAMAPLLSRRSQYHLEFRHTRREEKMSPAAEHDADGGLSMTIPKPDASPQLRISGEETPRKAPSIASLDNRQSHGKSLLAEEIDSESNVPTPLARPVEDHLSELHDHVEKRLTPVHEIGSFTLPPSLHTERSSPRRRLDSAPLSIISQDSHMSSTEGYDFYDLEAVDKLPQAIDVPKKKEPFSLDYVEPRSPNSRRKPAARHDSNESFGQMFSISDASRQNSSLTDSSGGSTNYTVKRVLSNRTESDDLETDFGSRIRGKEMRYSPESNRYPISSVPERDDTGSLTEDFVESQATTDTLDSDKSWMAQELPPARHEVKPPAPLKRGPLGLPSVPRPEDNTSPTITDTDFLPWTNDPPYPQPLFSDAASNTPIPPVNPYDILTRAFAFEVRHSALNASAMILLLKPLMPEGVIDSHQAAAILRQHHNRLMGMQLFVEAALLRNLCVQGWPDGLKMWGENYTAIFAPAQQQVTVAFNCSNCHKPREVDRSNPEGPGIWQCERCREVMAPCAVCGLRDATADRLPPVPLSEAANWPFDSLNKPILTTWWYCPGCAHGGHANCLQDWHAPIAPTPHRASIPSTSEPPATLSDRAFPETNSDGCCPFDGCGHACLPGRWRNETSAARTEELGRAVREQTRGTVTVGTTSFMKTGKHHGGSSSADASLAPTPSSSIRGDGFEVPQSRAVESVREALSSTTAAAAFGGGDGTRDAGRGLTGILSSSPSSKAHGATPSMFSTGSVATASAGGVGGRDGGRERRKSVKFAGEPSSERW